MSKRSVVRGTPLVVGYLERVSRRILSEHRAFIRESVRGRSGIYVLYDGPKLYYLGLASDLPIRLSHHLKDRHQEAWDHFSLYLVDLNRHLKGLESLFLRIVRPKGNKVTGNLRGAENLKRALRRTIREQHRRDFAELIGGERPHGAQGARDKTSAGAAKKAGRGAPVLAPYVTRRLPLRMEYKGRTVKAAVLKDGRIRCNGRVYNSPSIAGAKAIGRATLNGWTAWTFKDASGKWVYIDALRKRRR